MCNIYHCHFWKKSAKVVVREITRYSRFWLTWKIDCGCRTCHTKLNMQHFKFIYNQGLRQYADTRKKLSKAKNYRSCTGSKSLDHARSLAFMLLAFQVSASRTTQNLTGWIVRRSMVSITEFAGQDSRAQFARKRKAAVSCEIFQNFTQKTVIIISSSTVSVE